MSPGTYVTADTTYKLSTFILPGQPWLNNQRNVINAHTGSFVFDNGAYYRIGTHKLNNNESTGLTSGGIHCYRSTNRINWDDMGFILRPSTDTASDIGADTRIERSKVVFNASTGKYVVYFTIFTQGTGLTIGYTGTAISNSITGPYVYQEKFLASSAAGIGDFALHKEANGDLYHIGVRRSDSVLVVAKMSTGYLTPATTYTVCANLQISTEAPAILLRNGIYHLLGSGSNGWEPTAHRYFTVLLTLKKGTLKKEMGASLAIGFFSIFWNTAWTNGQAPHTLGILYNLKTPAFDQFLTQYHSNYQWWYAMSHSNAILLDSIAGRIQPIVRVIDDWYKARRLGLLFECKVGTGKLLVSDINLLSDAEKRPEAKQFLYSLKNYIVSSKFNPTLDINATKISNLYEYK